MAVILTKCGERVNRGTTNEYVIDTDDDVDKLPGLEECAPGSNALSIATGNLFVMDSVGDWKLLGGG